MSPDDEKREESRPEVEVQRAMRVLYLLLREQEGVLKTLIAELPAPTPGELEELAAGKRPFPLAALLIAELWQAVLLIEQAETGLEIAARYGPREGQRRRRQGWGIDTPPRMVAQIRAALSEIQAGLPPQE